MWKIILVLLLSLLIVGCIDNKEPMQPTIEQPIEITEINLGGESDGVHYYPPRTVIPIPREVDVYVSPNDPNGYREPELEPPSYIYGGGGYYYVPPVIPSSITIWQGNIVVTVE